MSPFGRSLDHLGLRAASKEAFDTIRERLIARDPPAPGYEAHAD